MCRISLISLTQNSMVLMIFQTRYGYSSNDHGNSILKVNKQWANENKNILNSLIKYCYKITILSHQTHRLVHKINEALEPKQYCSTAFLDVSQAFDKVWHTELLHKLWQFLPLSYYLILKSYLHNRHFQVKVEDYYTDFLPINTGVPQGSVLGPLLYLLYTADLPTSPDSTIATFANDTSVLATDPDPTIAIHKLQTSLHAIQHWLTKWQLKANRLKSTHVTFTTRRATCPRVHTYNEQFPQAHLCQTETSRHHSLQNVLAARL
jgi:hypothetical protein